MNNKNVCIECGSVGTYAKGLCRKCYNAVYRATHKSKIAAYEAQRRAKNGGLSMRENKECGAYLGIHVAGRLLANVFTGAIEVMPYGNRGFDFICGRGLKVDAKSATLGENGRWSFCINKNTTADFFATLAFDNRFDLNLQHFHLIPGDVVNNLTAFSFRPSTVYKWNEYRRSTDELLSCCNVMKNKEELINVNG